MFITGGVAAHVVKAVFPQLKNWLRHHFARRSEEMKALEDKYKSIFLEGKGNRFNNPPQDQKLFLSLIYDADMYGYKELANKMSSLRFAWSYSALGNNPSEAQEAGILPNDRGFFDENRANANRLADEIHEEMKSWRKMSWLSL
jgi:hypothetical protein